MRVEGHTVPIGALQPQQGDVVLPALTVILPVDDDAFRRESALKVIPLLCVVVPQPQDVTRGITAKPETESDIEKLTNIVVLVSFPITRKQSVLIYKISLNL